MEAIRHILKRFEEWATGLHSKFRSDFFFRSTIYVVALQTGFVVVSVVAFSSILHYSNGQVIETVITHIAASAPTSTAAYSPILPQSIDAIQNASVAYVFAGIVAVGILFGTLLAYATLRPARNSLQYQKLFISNVAHELRTPLSTIKTSTEVTLLDPTISPDVRETLKDTVGELDRISDIINNLLSLNSFLRPERMEFANIDLGPIAEKVAARIRPLANQYAIDIRIKKHEYSTVWGNAAGLEQVMTNLVKNAVSYTPKGRGGVVTISVEPDYSGAIVLAVADTGVGIAQKDLFHIFEPFYRADLSRARRVKHEGSGLGLAIVNEITRAHRGKIHIQSAVGKGTTVSITLPSGTTPPGEAPHPAAEKESQSEISVDFSKGV